MSLCPSTTGVGTSEGNLDLMMVKVTSSAKQIFLTCLMLICIDERNHIKRHELRRQNYSHLDHN
jgi:hypothetical protein